MSLLAAASTDEGGITGFLLDLVQSLGPVGVGLSILWPQVVALAIMGFVTLWLASKRFKKTLA